MSDCDLDIPREKMVELFANSGDPDQMPCFGVSRLQWVKALITTATDAIFIYPSFFFFVFVYVVCVCVFFRENNA